jgi:hypothetical protein
MTTSELQASWSLCMSLFLLYSLLGATQRFLMISKYYGILELKDAKIFKIYTSVQSLLFILTSPNRPIMPADMRVTVLSSGAGITPADAEALAVIDPP